MAINMNIYSNGNSSSKSVSVDFVTDFLASSANGVSNETKYFLKFTTNARTEDNQRYGAKIAEGMDDLVLNGEKQRMANTASDYTTIKTMIVDYLYDYVHGHDAGQNGTSVSEQKPMKFN